MPIGRMIAGVTSTLLLAAGGLLAWTGLHYQEANASSPGYGSEILDPIPFGPGLPVVPREKATEVILDPVAITGPDQLVIPSLGMKISIVDGSRATDGGVILPPSDLAAIYTESAPLDARTGATVIAGHVNYEDGSWAPMSAIARVTDGTVVQVSDSAGVVSKFTVKALDSYPKQALPDRIFQRKGERALILITCGTLETVNGKQSFTHNIVVTATKSGTP